MTTPPHTTDEVSVDPALHLVIAAENELALTWQRLNTLRLRAFYAGRYDSDEYDLAVREFRAAEGTLRTARSSWQRNPSRLRLVPGAGSSAGPATYEPKAA